MSDRDPTQRKRWLPQLVRSLHIWLSMIAFGATMLFSITGLTLNHAEWFESAEPHVVRVDGELDVGALRGEPDRLRIAEDLRERHGLRGRVTQFEVDERELFVLWKTAGYSADVIVDRDTGRYEGEVARRGFWAIVDDLHKGRDCGPVWSLVVDVAAVLLTVLSATGLWLLLYLKKRLRTGILLGFLGGATVAISYVFTVR